MNQDYNQLSSNTGLNIDNGSRAGFDISTTKIEFLLILRALRRWWWLILLVTVAFTGLTGVLLSRMTPVYKAVSVLEVNQEERNVIDVSEVESVVVDQEFLTTQIKLLQSRSLIEGTIESLNLFSDPYLVPYNTGEGPLLSRAERTASLINSFDRKLTVAPVGRSRLIQVTFEHSDPVIAAKILNGLTANYIERGLSRKLNATAFAQTFLEDRLKSVRTSLEASERELVAYAAENNFVNVSNGPAQEDAGELDKAILKTFNQELANVRLARVNAEVLYNQSLGSNFTAELLENDSLSSLELRRLELVSEYQEKLAIFKPAFPEMLELKRRIDIFALQIEKQEVAISSSSAERLKNSYDLILKREADLIERIDALKSSVVNIRERSIDYNILKRQVETERAQYDALLQRLKEVSVADNLGSSLVEVVDFAKAPRNPFKPNILRGVIFIFLLSGVISFVLSYALEVFDDRVKTPDDVKNRLNQILMGVIPQSEFPDGLVDELADAQTSVAEAYASLRTNLKFYDSDGGPRVVQVTSTRSGEGKSVTALGVCLRLVGLSHKVLLIDADLRRPTFKGSSKTSVGLSGLLTQSKKFEEEITRSRYEGLSFITSGEIVPNPSELLASEKFKQLLAWARDEYDYVIVDSPPVLGLADAPILGALVDASLLVVHAGKIRTKNITSSIERLSNSATKILGVVLTQYKNTSQGYGNYYQYAYGAAATQYGGEKHSRGGSNNIANAKKELMNLS